MDSGLLILGLHRVGLPPAEAQIRGLFITPQILKFQIKMLRALGYRFTTLSEAMVAPSGKRAVLTFDDGYADNYANAFPLLRRLGVPATLFAITGDVGARDVVWNEAGDKTPADMLDWDSINELKDAGWEIGSHAHSHVHLTRYEESHQEELIARSLDAIEKYTGTRPLSFAYPYGDYDGRTKQVLKRLGIRYGVTTNRAKVGEPSTDHLELKRTPLGGRYFFHYFKNAMRTRQAIGNVEIARSLYPYFIPSGLVSSADSVFFSQIKK